MNRRPGPALAQGTGWRQRRVHKPLKARLMRAATVRGRGDCRRACGGCPSWARRAALLTLERGGPADGASTRLRPSCTAPPTFLLLLLQAVSLLVALQLLLLTCPVPTCLPSALSCQVRSPLPVLSPLLASPSGFTLRPSPFTCSPLGNASAPAAHSPHFCLSPTFPFPWRNTDQPPLGLRETAILPSSHFPGFFFFPLCNGLKSDLYFISLFKIFLYVCVHFVKNSPNCILKMS